MKPIWLICRRELKEILVNRATLLLVVVFGVAAPIFFAYNASSGTASLAESVGGLSSGLAAVSLLPLLLSVQLATLAFAGEREYGTLVTLLATPVPREAVYRGKLVSCFVPALLLSLFGQAVFLITASFVSPGRLQYLPLAFIAFVLLAEVASLLLLLTVGLFVSTRANTVRAAQQAAGPISAPLVFGFIYCAAVLFYRHPLLVATGAGVLVVVDVVLLMRARQLWNGLIELAQA